MFPWLRTLGHLVRSQCLSSGKALDRNLAKQTNLRRGNFLHSQSLHMGKAEQHLHGSRTLVCNCSTASHAVPDDGMKSAGETSPTDGKDEEPARVTAARLELEVMRNAGADVPEHINEFDLDYFSTLNSKRSRKRFLAFLFKKEKHRSKAREKRRLASEERATEVSSTTAEEDLDAPMKNRLFLQLQQQSVHQFDSWRLAAGMRFGPKLVFDFSYEEHMRRPEMISLAQQLMLGVAANKLAKDPFDVHWAGLLEDSGTMREMRRMLGQYLDAVMVNVTDRQVQDMFPHEDIVYLTADSPNILRSYNPNKVYVIGALVDSHRILTGVSLAKAKRLDLSHARLPLDLFLKWSSGGKNLTLDQMMHILIELNTSGDWVKALNHVPTRKHLGLKSERPADELAPDDGREARGFTKSPTQQEARFSSSRAKQSRSWPILDEPAFSRSKRVNTATVRQRVKQLIGDEKDAASETIFRSGGGYGVRKKNTTQRNRDKHWFED